MNSILVCEDNPADVRLLEEAIRVHGLSCALHVVRDGEEAQNFLERLDAEGLPCPGAIIMDLHLPRIEGRELIQSFREHGWCLGVPIVVLTSSISPKDEEEVCALGVHSYVRKPTNLEEFLEIGALLAEVLEARTN
ncbi:MAG: response regulator [Bryobacteraceae bacterium]